MTTPATTNTTIRETINDYDQGLTSNPRFDHTEKHVMSIIAFVIAFIITYNSILYPKLTMTTKNKPKINFIFQGQVIPRAQIPGLHTPGVVSGENNEGTTWPKKAR